VRLSARVQTRVARVQVHPVPLMAVAVKPAGKVSVSCTIPDVLVKSELDTVI
jgi:hypothetical protein